MIYNTTNNIRLGRVVLVHHIFSFRSEVHKVVVERVQLVICLFRFIDLFLVTGLNESRRREFT